MKSILTFAICLISSASMAQQYFNFANSATRSRTEWHPQNSPTNMDINRSPIGWIDGSWPFVGDLTFVMNTDTVRFGKLAGSGVRVAGLSPNGSLYSFPMSGYISSTDTTVMLSNYYKKSDPMLLTLLGYGTTAFGWGNHATAGYLTQQYAPTAGEGIVITGSSPTQTIAVDTSVASAGDGAIMYMGKANSVITGLQNGINSKEPTISAGSSMEYWRGDKTWRTLNTTVVPEGTNQYFTNTRARSSISITTTGTGASTYNSTTGVLNIPTPTSSTPGTNNATAYSSGTPYTLTTTPAKVDFGTTDPSITLPAAGTYLILANVKIEYTGLTNLAIQTCNFKLRRTNNTAADLPNAGTNFNVPITTLLTQTGGDADIQSIIYTTTNSNDTIEVWGNRGAGISAGSIQVGEASIVAIRIY